MMQDIVIKNVKTVEYEKNNLNQLYDPEGEHKNSFEFQRGNVISPFKNGEGKLSINFYILQPGKSNYPYHQHFGREEAFYIISGTATLRTHSGEMEVKEGDIIVFPANENGAHMLTNTSDAPVHYIDIDTYSSHDVVVYPDSDKVRVFAGGIQKSFKMQSEVNYLDCE